MSPAQPTKVIFVSPEPSPSEKVSQSVCANDERAGSGSQFERHFERIVIMRLRVGDADRVVVRRGEDERRILIRGLHSAGQVVDRRRVHVLQFGSRSSGGRRGSLAGIGRDRTIRVWPFRPRRADNIRREWNTSSRRLDRSCPCRRRRGIGILIVPLVDDALIIDENFNSVVRGHVRRCTFR